MTGLERFELAAIAVLVTTIWFRVDLLPLQISVANLVLLLSGLLLLQGLIRDLAIIFIRRNRINTIDPKVARCMCLESTIGLIGVLFGVGFMLLSVFFSVEINQFSWALVVLLTSVIGFLIKDLVIQLGPWRVLREKDHQHIIFSWKTPGK